MIFIFELYYLVATLFLTGKDADSYLLKDKTDNALSAGRVKRWHADGFALAVLFVVPWIIFRPAGWYEFIIAAFLIRGFVFDPFFNHWADLRIDFLGTTANSDGIFTRIFGKDGAVRKSITALIILLALNTLKIFNKI